MSQIITLLPGEAPAPRGKVWLIGAGPGAADLLTRRAEKAIASADVILFDSLISDDILALAPPRTEKVFVGKRKGAHSISQDGIHALMVERAARGQKVARLKAGDPSVYGRSGEEIAALAEANIDFEIVPGVTAALAAAADAKIPLTRRGLSSTLVFATGHNRNGDILPDWAQLALSGATVALYMAKTVAAETSDLLIRAGLDAATPVLAVENASRADKRLFTGTLADLPALAAKADVDGPVLILIGEVAGSSLSDALEPLGENQFTVLRRA